MTDKPMSAEEFAKVAFMRAHNCDCSYTGSYDFESWLIELIKSYDSLKNYGECHARPRSCEAMESTTQCDDSASPSPPINGMSDEVRDVLSDFIELFTLCDPFPKSFDHPVSKARKILNATPQAALSATQGLNSKVINVLKKARGYSEDALSALIVEELVIDNSLLPKSARQTELKLRRDVLVKFMLEIDAALEAPTNGATRAAAPDAWQDISTAPRDGTQFLAMEDDGSIYKSEFFNEDDDGRVIWSCYSGQPTVYDPEPKYWQPLPAAPNQSGGQ